MVETKYIALPDVVLMDIREMFKTIIFSKWE